jgi:hypothetical protein
MFKLPANTGGTSLFEERVVICLATSSEEALEKGRAEARRHAQCEPRPKFLAHLVVFCIEQEELAEGEEVWRQLRRIEMSDDDFLARVYEEEQVDIRHVE